MARTVNAKSNSPGSFLYRLLRNPFTYFGGVGALLVLALVLKRDDISWAIQLARVKLISDRFYSEYKGIAKDIHYGPNPNERLDVFQPSTPGPHPVLLFVHGGGWRSYSKELHAPVALKLLPHDVVTVLVEYTLYPGAMYRQQTEETARSIAWTLENISRYGGDASRIVVGGQSAGAHLTALAVLDKSYLAATGHSSDELCGLYGISGPYDINRQLEFEKENGRDGQGLVEVFGGEGNFTAGSPVSFIRADLPPLLLIHGDADETVPVDVSMSFQDRLVAAGARSELHIYPGASHVGLLLDALATDPARLVTDLVQFTTTCPRARVKP